MPPRIILPCLIDSHNIATLSTGQKAHCQHLARASQCFVLSCLLSVQRERGIMHITYTKTHCVATLPWTEGQGKIGSICASECLSTSVIAISQCVLWGIPLPTTLSGSRSPGRTPPDVGARTPCPKAKARNGSNTRHGLPHSTCTPLTSLLTNARQGRQR